MAILPDDVRNQQDRERRAARLAARVAAGAMGRLPRRVGIERAKGRATPAPPRRATIVLPIVASLPPPEPPGTCSCGCRGATKGPTSRFLPGHDSRYHALVRTAERVARLRAAL